ncbi:ATP-binding protein [Shouchella patagoniensis]|uniref:ATP-binding protein n=1 Tax=Shouchella patagoniensis TaxID=228576 RepID=UPI00099572CE|nr:sensor histidine kinase [Shouchella patagoniensis]
MVIEKLVLNVFVILVPVLIYSLKAEGSWKIQRSLTMFLFMSGAVVLSMAFSVEIEGIHLDLRFVPTLLAFLYGGRRAGWGVAGVALIGRMFQGGDMVLLGIGLILLTTVIFSVFAPRFYSLPPKWPRVRCAVLFSFIPTTIQLGAAAVLWEMTETRTMDSLWSIGLEYMLFFTGATLLVTHLYETLLERERILAELVAVEKHNTMGELAASIAHEVRNPLTVVKGFIQLLAEEKDQNQNQYHKLILSELDRAESIIHEYLNASKPQRNESCVIALEEHVKSVVALMEPYATKNNLQLKGQYEAEVSVFVDEKKLKQSLMNFIKNAIEATPVQGDVTVTLRATKEKALVLIEDTGYGMTKAQLKQLGTAYFTTKETGTGLGTMVSIRMIEMMGGTVTYKSKLQKGTCVEVVLPLHG